MPFSASFWNVEKFEGKRARSDRVERHIRGLTADGEGPSIIAFCELKDKSPIRKLIQRNFDDYDFGMTDTGGLRAFQSDWPEIELLVGWKRGVFDQVIFTQRVELKADRDSIRPGALLNVRQKRTWHTLLFLHTKSGPNSESYNLRKTTFKRIWNLKKRLDAVEPYASGPDRSRFLVMGDLNTMGNGRRGVGSMTGPQEVAKLARDAARNGMQLVTKEHDETFRKQYSRTKIY